MKHTKWIVTGIGAVLMALVAGSFLAQEGKTPSSVKDEVALRTAMEKETVQGDLKGAIEQYKKLAQSSDHAIAAQALIHMGECYEKLGSNEARKQYALIISKFADQKDAVAQARAHLGEAATKTNGMSARLIWESGGTVEAAVSPDGRYVSFSDDSSNLALHDLSTRTDRRLTSAESKDDFVEGSAFSPDGKQIAYAWYSKKDLNYDLRILSLSGTGPAVPRVLLKSADFQWYGPPAWSPDGKWLAVMAARKGGSGKPDPILVVSVQDGSFRALGSNFSNENLYFSPDGKYLAFSRTTGGDSDVFVLAIDGGREIPAVVNPSQDLAMGWSPDGHLLFASDRGGSMGLWAMPFRDGKPQGSPARIKSDIGSGSMGLTSSGALYYHVTSGETSSYLQTAAFDFAAGRIISSAITVGTGTAPTWSPDGKYLAYMTPSTAGHKPILKIATEAGGTRELASDHIPFATEVSWSPDGRSLAGFAGGLFQVDVQTGQFSLSRPNTPLDYVVGAPPAWSLDQEKLYFRRSSNPTGGGDGSIAFIERDLASGSERVLIQRPKSTDLGGLNLSPDGRYIATHADPPNSSAIVLIPVAGGEPKELLRRPGLGSVSFSPDGRYIALVGGASRSALLIPVAGGEPRELMIAAAPLTVGMAMWAPDSKSIFLKKTTADNEQTEIWRVPLDGGQAVKLDMNMNPDHILGGFRVSPSGSQIAFVRGEATATPAKDEIWVLENFLSSIPASK